MQYEIIVSVDRGCVHYKLSSLLFLMLDKTGGALIITLQIGDNASLNAQNVNALDRQNLSQYSAGPCEW